MSGQDEKGIGWAAGEAAQYDKEFTSKRFFGSEEILMNRGRHTSCNVLCTICECNGSLGWWLYEKALFKK